MGVESWSTNLIKVFSGGGERTIANAIFHSKSLERAFDRISRAIATLSASDKDVLVDFGRAMVGAGRKIMEAAETGEDVISSLPINPFLQSYRETGDRVYIVGRTRASVANDFWDVHISYADLPNVTEIVNAISMQTLQAQEMYPQRFKGLLDLQEYFKYTQIIYAERAF